IGPASGAGLWAPIARADLSARLVPAPKLPGFARSMADLCRMADGDLLLASKPRLGSAGVGYLARARSGRPLLLDIADWEIGFFLRGGVGGATARTLTLRTPAGLPWTWLMGALRRLADGITVSSRFLQRRFGGLLLPHVRDTTAWKPGAADGAAARRR